MRKNYIHIKWKSSSRPFIFYENSLVCFRVLENPYNNQKVKSTYKHTHIQHGDINIRGCLLRGIRACVKISYCFRNQHSG